MQKKKSQNRAAKYIKLELWEMFIFLCRKRTKLKQNKKPVEQKNRCKQEKHQMLFSKDKLQS